MAAEPRAAPPEKPVQHSSRRLCGQDDDSHDMSAAAEPAELQNTAQEPARLPIPRPVVAQSKPADSKNTTVGGLPVASSVKHAMEAELPTSSERRNYELEETPQQSFIRLGHAVYHSPIVFGRIPRHINTAQPPEAAAANASWTEAFAEVQQTAHRASPEIYPGASLAIAPADVPQTPQNPATNIVSVGSPNLLPITAPALPSREGEPARAPEALMDPFKMDQERWNDINKSLQEIVPAASDSTRTRKISVMGSELLTKQDVTKYPKQLLGMHGATVRESQEFSARSPSQAAAVKSKPRLLVYGPKSSIVWDLAAPFETLTMKMIKEDSPLSPSPEFRGFIFTFVGGGVRYRSGTEDANERECTELVEARYRHRFEIKDGDEREFAHFKLDVEECMETSKEANQGNGVYLSFSLHIQELRGLSIKENNAGS